MNLSISKSGMRDASQREGIAAHLNRKYPCLIIEADGTISISEMNYSNRDTIEIAPDNPLGRTVHRILDAGGKLQCLRNLQTDQPYAMAVVASGISDELVQMATHFLSALETKRREYLFTRDEQRTILHQWRQGEVFLRMERRAGKWMLTYSEIE